jgi:ABC-type transport system involved in multi-copper enzyme maturation permease subunit
MVLVGKAIGWISVGQQVQVVKHFSLAIISFFGALISVFVGTSLIYKETDKRTIYTILSKPVSRYQFLTGKYFGLSAVLFIVIFFMGVAVSVFVKYGLGGELNAIFFQAIAMTYLELLVVTAVAILFSTVASPILSAIFTFCTYLVGQVTPSLLDIVNFKPVSEKGMQSAGVDGLSKFLTVSHDIMAPVSKVLYIVLPNLTHFSLRNRVVYGPELQRGEFSGAVIYAICYCGVCICLAIAFFNRKKF